jgi:glutathione S-transferase
MPPRLYTFSISHFAEKARWALDYKGIAYEEARLVPGTHMAIVRRIAPRTTVPVLVDRGRVIQGSSAIIDWADTQIPERRLTPSDASESEGVIELERWLDVELGEPLRRVFYHYALEHRELVISLFTQGGPWWGKSFCRLAFPLIRQRIRGMYAINEVNVAADKERIAAVHERIDGLLASSPYLVGDRFTRADLTLAALLAPMWMPDEHPTRWPRLEAYPAQVNALRARFEQTRARAHALRAYREHRARGKQLAA